MILGNINKESRNRSELQQLNNATAVINWFNKVENKNKDKFMIFHIKDFYSSITKKLSDCFINFTRQHVQIKRQDFNIMQHARKSLLYNKEILLQKKKADLLDVSMGAYDEAEVCETVGLFLLNNLAIRFDKNSVGLYKGNGLALFENINSHPADKIRKEFHQLFKENSLSLQIKCNL